jgi:pyrroloquinoline-quinone synthase
MTTCPACLDGFAAGDYAGLAGHFVDRAAASDSDHIRWLNQNLSRRKVDAAEVEERLREYLALGPASLGAWIRRRFIARFFGESPHPFVVALQHPSRAVLLGYVLEHHHFLRQWVRSCAYILGRTDRDEVVEYEIDNITTEFGGWGPDRPSHYELLLRMGEALGVPRPEILASPPRPATRRGVEGWARICSAKPWVSAMAAMHSLELIAHRGLVDEGAKLHYFDPAILRGDEIPAAARAFLREGYEADVGHSDRALALVERFADTPELVEDAQSTFLRSVDLFDDYLMARLERASDFEGPS